MAILTPEEYEEHLRIKKIIKEQQRLLRENPKLKGKTDAQLWANELRSRSTKAQMADPQFRQEWDEKNQAGIQKRVDSIEWQEKNKLGREKMKANVKWQEKNTLSKQQLADTIEWREKNKLANQTRLNKLISCDGVIFPSRTSAELALAPATRKTSGSKSKWFGDQMKKYPERYFYV